MSRLSKRESVRLNLRTRTEPGKDRSGRNQLSLGLKLEKKFVSE